jgi:hypothetical protein
VLEKEEWEEYGIQGGPMKPSRIARRLIPEQKALLREVIARQAPELLPMLPRAELNVLFPHERQQLCQLISHEFMQSGRRPDDEPNARGLKLEDLLDVINRPSLFPAE